MKSDPTQRFSSRVEDYIRYRPSYPRAMIEWIASECGLTARSQVADIGSGTGILSALLLECGCEVYGVEPNADMRLAAERLLAGETHFHSVAGRAEDTTLSAASVDFVTAAQAFHWFDPAPTRAEFQRILRPGGRVVLVWNERLVTGEFLTGYEALLHRHAPDYAKVDHRQIDGAALTRFFGHDAWRMQSFPNHQDFDWDGLRGRLMSSSYAPMLESPSFQPMMDNLAEIFERGKQGGQVRVEYETKIYLGQF